MENAFLSKIPDLMKWIESNPLIITLTSGGAIVWLFANLKSIFTAIVNCITALISFTIENIYEDARGYGVGYNIKMKQLVFNNLLSKSKTLWERTVNLDLSNSIDFSTFGSNPNAVHCYEKSQFYDFQDQPIDNDSSNTMSANATNTYGFSIRLILGKIAFVNRSYKLDGQRITMNTKIRVFFAFKKKFMEKIEDEINKAIMSNINQDKNFISVINSDSLNGKKMKRSLQSIFTKDDIHIDLFNAIKDFINNVDTYRRLNYPYNFCGLLYGVPGSGKTSTILAIASELKRDVYYVNLAQTNATKLLTAFNDDPRHSIFVFEDIDAISYNGANNRDPSKEEKDDGNEDRSIRNISKFDMASGISLSDLLNITDGLLASDGTICLFTTNHIEKLDPAFFRAGRMNKIIEFTYMDKDTAKNMVDAYLNVPNDMQMKDNIKPAELQECILDILLKKKTIEDLKKNFTIEA